MTATKRKGLKSGTRTEFSIFAKVKPGHAKALTEVLMGGAVQDPKVLREGLKAIGTLHEARWVMFDDDTRVMFCSSFEIADDAAASAGVFKVKRPAVWSIT
jgi:hypothetical protein